MNGHTGIWPWIFSEAKILSWHPDLLGLGLIKTELSTISNCPAWWRSGLPIIELLLRYLGGGIPAPCGKSPLFVVGSYKLQSLQFSLSASGSHSPAPYPTGRNYTHQHSLHHRISKSSPIRDLVSARSGSLFHTWETLKQNEATALDTMGKWAGPKEKLHLLHCFD